MRIVRTTVRSITVDFCRQTYRLNGEKIDSVASFGKIVSTKQLDDGFLVCYQDATDLLSRQEVGNFDGELLDETFNRADFYSFEELASRKAFFFEPKTINASIYLEENASSRRLCYFNPSDFDDTLTLRPKRSKKKKRVVMFESVAPVIDAPQPAFYLCGTEKETKEGVERVWELWKDNERVKCDRIVFTDLFKHGSFGEDWWIGVDI